jgi:hypothetical protein
MAEFTKGAWYFETVRTSCGLVHRIGPFPWKRDKKIHACIYVDWPGDGAIERELRANAVLMTAAPDMFEALQFCVDRLAILQGEDAPGVAEGRAALSRAGA